jgi:prepilin-type N-terminal cleavage/methylation domain-containing protein
MRNTKGFTLVELIIVIVIVGILSIVAVPMYRGYTRKAMASEGKALLGGINSSQKVYYAENSSFASSTTGSLGYDTLLDVDARANKYFGGFTVTGGVDSFTATTTADPSGQASGITLTLTASSIGMPTITESGY